MIKWFGSKTSAFSSAVGATGKTFEDHILIIPAVSVGNVGQLTIDLVLENAEGTEPGTKPKKIGQLFHSGLEPVVANNIEEWKVKSGKKNRPTKQVGPVAPNVTNQDNLSDNNANSSTGQTNGSSNPTSNTQPDANNDKSVEHQVVDEDSIMTACEIFHCPAQRWIIVQFHSPIRKRDTQKFVNFLTSWIQEACFSMVVCFSSIFSSERMDAHIRGLAPKIQVLYSEKIDCSYLEKIKALGWKRLLSQELATKPNDLQFMDQVEENLASVSLSGSGITKVLLQTCQSTGIPCLSLMLYASDGFDNTVDAILLYKEAAMLFKFIPDPPKFGDPPPKIKIPPIWHSHLGLTPKLVAKDDEATAAKTGSRRKHKEMQQGNSNESSNPPATIF